MVNLRIAQLSTSSTGGAAIAAQRLTEVLGAHQIESVFVQDTHNVVKPRNSLISKIVTGAQDSATRNAYGIATPVSISKIDRELLVQEFEVVHIHNWYNLLSLEDIVYIGNRIPIVFTMHDERLLTGGCHMTLGCNSFKHGCNDCPAVRFGKHFISNAKDSISEVLLQLPSIAVITPSIWMKKQWGLAYPTLAHMSQYIPNIIDHPSQLVTYSDESDLLEILFISANLATPVKGLETLLKALESTDLSSRIRLNIVGKGNLDSFPSNLNLNLYGELPSKEVYKVMSKCDLLVVPSFSENSPNVIAEAQLLGLPVLASRVGGIPELIQHEVTGFLTQPDEISLTSELVKLSNRKDFSEVAAAALKSAQGRWDNDINTVSHIGIYKKVLNI